jgi:formate-dependent nitrite reductase membrane component NrfD
MSEHEPGDHEAAQGSDGPAERAAESLSAPSRAPEASGAGEPPTTHAGRETAGTADHDPDTRDTTPAVGTRGAPASWRRAVEGADVALARRGWGDAQWSFLYKDDTNYARAEPRRGQVAEANRRMRSAEPGAIHGPFIHAPVWTWEVPVYFWFGGMASGASFVSLACDLAGDERSAAIARAVALAAVLPAPPLLILDLGRPGRFLNMLRIFKPRSPMNVGAWCLVAFSTTGAGAVAADVLGRPRVGQGLGAATAILGSYLGSYTGVLLASTAVPLWARSRAFLGPIFVATATATGAAATRLALVARGLPEGHPTRHALGTIETGAMLTELVLSTFNERRLGQAGQALRQGHAGRLFTAAKWTVRVGLALRPLRRRLGPRAHHVASGSYLAGGLLFRMAWVAAGRASAADHEAVAATARAHVTRDDEVGGENETRRLVSRWREPSSGRGVAARAWTEGVRRTSLLAERVLRLGADPSAPR